MNNDKYAKYNSGKVTYGSNGAYHTSDSRYGSQASNNGCAKYLLAIILVAIILVASYIVGKADNDNSYYRPNPLGCVPYTHAMVISHYAQGLTHTSCNGERAKERSSNSNDDSDNPTNNSTTVINPPVDNPPTVTPPVVNPPSNEDSDKKAKHANNGGGNGQELDSDGNDLDPNDNPHANDND